MIKLELTPAELDLINLALNVYRENLQYDEIHSNIELQKLEDEATNLINKLEAV